MSPCRRWKEFDINYLRRNYPNKSVESIARSLKRSSASILGKVYQLKIYVPKPKRWSEDELNMLRKLWINKRYSIDEVAAKLNKTRQATHYQAWKMGLRRPQVWRFWKKEETAYLRRNYKVKTYREIAEHLGISTPAVFKKAIRIGLKLREAPRPWTEAEDEFIRQNYRKIPTKEIAQKLNRATDSIINRAGPLGISKGKRKL